MISFLIIILLQIITFVSSTSIENKQNQLNYQPLHLQKGKHLYPIHLHQNETIEIFYDHKLSEDIKVIYLTKELMIISPEEIDVYYLILSETQHPHCIHCPFNCDINTHKCFNGLKNAVFTFDSFLDLILPSRSLLVFIIFLVLVIVTLIMTCTMCCRFIDCLTDMCCDPKKKKDKLKEKKHKEKFQDMVARVDMQDEIR